jgi:hypothetical protein
MHPRGFSPAMYSILQGAHSGWFTLQVPLFVPGRHGAARVLREQMRGAPPAYRARK